jgi:hypothetical protein
MSCYNRTNPKGCQERKVAHCTAAIQNPTAQSGKGKGNGAEKEVGRGGGESGGGGGANGEGTRG